MTDRDRLSPPDTRNPSARPAACVIFWAMLAALAVPWLSGCTSLRATTPLPPQSLVLDQLVIYSEVALPKQHRLLEELAAQRATLASKLALPSSDEPIHVYLFPTAEKFKTFLQAEYPALPDRRAFFVESDTRLIVYAYWGDRVAEDLRHEVAHGYLHSVVPNLPLWLDEGLAEYFEVPRGNRGVNRAHVQELAVALEQGWRPELRRLELMKNGEELTQIDYAEAWAWVHMLLETSPERQELLRGYLALLRRDAAAAEPLSNQLRRVQLDYERQLVDYLRWLSQSMR